MPGSLNPADNISCGLNPSELNLNLQWLQGHECLWRPESHWPNTAFRGVPDKELQLKQESHFKPGEQSVNSSSLHLTVSPADVLRKLLTSSSVWNTLIVREAWLVRFVQFLRNWKTVRKGHLTPDDYDPATTATVRIIQHSSYQRSGEAVYSW